MKKACNGCGRPFTPSRARESRCPSCGSGRRNGSTRQWRTQRDRILSAFGYRCAYCGEVATHVDHRMPLDRGGTDTEDNLAAACESCNLGKGTMTEREWRETLRART